MAHENFPIACRSACRQLHSRLPFPTNHYWWPNPGERPRGSGNSLNFQNHNFACLLCFWYFPRLPPPHRQQYFNMEEVAKQPCTRWIVSCLFSIFEVLHTAFHSGPTNLLSCRYGVESQSYMFSFKYYAWEIHETKMCLICKPLCPRTDSSWNASQ